MNNRNKQIIPYIELNGRYAKCSNCFKEVFPSDNICKHCGQKQDWSWFTKETINKLNKEI